MKKLNLWTKSLAALICAAALLVAAAGCENVAIGDGAASKSKGILKLNIIDSLSPPAKNNGIAASVGGISKTANPDDLGVSYWDAYQVSFDNQSGDNPEPIDIAKNDGRLNGNIITVEVAPGEYAVTITAFKDSVAVAKGVAQNVAVSAGVVAESQTVAILPKTKDEDGTLQNGILSYSIDLTGLTGLSKKTIYFTQDMTTTKVTAEGKSQEIVLNENIKTDDSASLPPGLYRVWVDLIKNSNWAGLNGDIVYIYSGQTSTLSSMTFTDANFSPLVGDDPANNGGVEGGMSFAGNITVTNWSENFTIAQNAGPVTFSITPSYTDIQWSLNQDNKGAGTTFVLTPSEYNTGIYLLLVIAKNTAGQWESSGGLSVTITAEAEEEEEEEEATVKEFSLSTLSEIETWIDGLPENTKDTYYTIKLAADGWTISSNELQNYTAIKDAILNKIDDKYIALDMSDVPITVIRGIAGVSNTSYIKELANISNLIGIIFPKKTMTNTHYAFHSFASLEWLEIPVGCSVAFGGTEFPGNANFKKFIINGTASFAWGMGNLDTFYSGPGVYITNNGNGVVSGLNDCSATFIKE
jgi:hypothetical protein